ncbi:hypothetical protein Y032_0227g2794 [Ancylostoma ceylanicum]|nr:hypothetical protein Y032_0227g2794 [Ancylostoma ceylanicum]
MEVFHVKDLNIFGSTKPSPLLGRKLSDKMIEQRNKKRVTLLRKMFKGKKAPPSAPQSSMEDMTTQTKTKEAIDDPTNVKKTKKKTKKKQKTPKTQKETPKSNSPDENKKRWWQLW